MRGMYFSEAFELDNAGIDDPIAVVFAGDGSNLVRRAAFIVYPGQRRKSLAPQQAPEKVDDGFD